jgi:DNA-binding beta-propeller fold protein YncE
MRVAAVAAVLLLLSTAVSAQVRIVQTNSQGDNIHLIDPATQKIVGEIKGVPVNHGAAAAPDGSRFYISSEAEQSLHVVDSKTLQTVKKIALSGRPNNISISKDGRRVYVAIVSAPGAVDVIDTSTMEKVKSIGTKGGIHNVYVTPDGRHVVAGSIAGRLMTVIDQKTDEPVWTLFNEGVGRWRSKRTPTVRPNVSSCSSPISTALPSWILRSARKCRGSSCPTTSRRTR